MNSRILIAALWVPTSLFAAEGTRPRIGLVLEGGGSLGLAHIGVLEWLEAHRIRVDYVTGTSMGGLVGGLFAAGKSPAEIRKLVETIDWNTVLAGETPFELLSYRRKEDRLAYPTKLEFGLRNGVSLPSGLNSGFEVESILDKALLPYSSLDHFDKLPIPFRCVATDMISGKQKVFDRGSLSAALRATMSIPAVFSPVVDGQSIYTDGGALNNLPVDVAKAMGADVIIASHLDTGPIDPQSIQSLLGAVDRTVSIMIAANELRSLQAADIVLSSDLRGFTSEDFTKGAEIIPRGIDAAKRKAGVLELLSAPLDQWASYLADRAKRQRTHVDVPTFLDIQGAGTNAKRRIETVLTPLLGQPLDVDTLSRKLRILTGEGILNSLGYGLTQQGEETGLVIRAAEKNHGPPFLNTGVIIDGSDSGDVRFGIEGRITAMNVAGAGSELRTDLRFGTTYAIASELYRPITAGSAWFVAPRAYAIHGRFDVYSGKSRSSQYATSRLGGGIDLGYRFGRLAEVRLGQDAYLLSGRLKIGQPIVANGSRTVSNSSLRFQYLGQDDVILPRRGLVQESRIDWFSRGATTGGHTAMRQQTDYFHPVSSRGSVILTAGSGISFGARQTGLESFSLGGPFRMSSYGTNELLGNRFFHTQAGYSHRLFPLNPILGEAVYAIGMYEIAKVYGNPQAPQLAKDGLLALVAKTAFGPVYVGASANGNRIRWWFGVGRIF